MLNKVYAPDILPITKEGIPGLSLQFQSIISNFAGY